MKYLMLGLVPLLLLCVGAPANNLVLRGLVSEVPDGKTVVVLSHNRKVTVVLKGVDAPELKQEFGDVARQHLERLILDKTVEVDFTQIKTRNVVGRVIWNQMDIGLQLIRDGVAWYDKNNNQELTDEERGLYAATEQAARSERRGLWEDGSPMPPWEWRRAQLAKDARPVTYKSNRRSSLGREDILFSKGHPTGNTPGNTKDRTSSAKPSGRPLNTPGQDYDFRSYLNQGRVSIVYFYADWCPACRETNPVMEEINGRIPDMQVLFMNIGDWNTPVAQRHGISFVPYLKVYDKTGNLIAEGKAARGWLLENLRQRL